MKKVLATVLKIIKYFVLLLVLAIVLSLAWLRWESGRPRDDWFTERHGQIETVATEESVTPYEQLSESVQLTSDSGLRVSFRIIRNTDEDEPQPVIIVLGGHRTGADAVDLFGDVGNHAVVGVDYPYDGPEKARGVIPILKTIPLARQAFRDTVPATSLVLDWLLQQPWVDDANVILVGASLGAPFASTIARRDQRVTALVLVHAAADNRLWMEVQVSRRIDAKILHYPLGTILYWMAYGPILDTDAHVATLSPRPLLIIAAHNDERTPADQAGLLLGAANEPKRLRYSDGNHVQPNRQGVVASLLRIVDEEMSFLMQ